MGEWRERAVWLETSLEASSRGQMMDRLEAVLVRLGFILLQWGAL